MFTDFFFSALFFSSCAQKNLLSSSPFSIQNHLPLIPSSATHCPLPTADSRKRKKKGSAWSGPLGELRDDSRASCKVPSERARQTSQRHPFRRIWVRLTRTVASCQFQPSSSPVPALTRPLQDPGYRSSVRCSLATVPPCPPCGFLPPVGQHSPTQSPRGSRPRAGFAGLHTALFAPPAIDHTNQPSSTAPQQASTTNQNPIFGDACPPTDWPRPLTPTGGTHQNSATLRCCRGLCADSPGTPSGQPACLDFFFFATPARAAPRSGCRMPSAVQIAQAGVYSLL